ncbi:Poly(A) RNA polymerase protein 2 [Smittium mucronatum]|uniref:polynucleotide adenylyltransferase n=1 Tax=Smittium mucronatum TaxID=133383 RepID=A0A1R0GWW6_9FUNG|nr:Poly(A) RNA polymerase protein 2 [Smittium mucronatum]
MTDFIAFDDFDDDSSSEKLVPEKHQARTVEPSENERTPVPPANKTAKRKRSPTPSSINSPITIDLDSDPPHFSSITNKSKPPNPPSDSSQKTLFGYDGKKLPPWIIPSKTSIPKRSEPVHEILNEEVRKFIEYISPTPEEHAIRGWVLDKLKLALSKLFKPTEDFSVDVICFGSYLTNLYLPSSDLDVAVIITQKSTGKISQIHEDKGIKRKLLHKISQTIRRNGFSDYCEIIAGARVPLVKTTEKYSKISLDISINSTSGLKTAAIMNNLLDNKYPVVLRGLVLVIKQFLQEKHMNEVYTGGLGSYATLLMIVSFLQHHPRVRTNSLSLEKNMGVLLIEFFELYGKCFNYELVGISVSDSGEYIQKVNSSGNDRRSFNLYVQDPGDSENDVTKGTYGIDRIRRSFSRAFEQLTFSIFKYHQVRKLGKTLNPTIDENQLDSFHPSKKVLINGRKSSVIQEPKYDLNMPVSFLSSIISISNQVLNKRLNYSLIFHENIFQNELGIKYSPETTSLLNDLLPEKNNTHTLHPIDYTPNGSVDREKAISKAKAIKGTIKKFEIPSSPGYVAASSDSSDNEKRSLIIKSTKPKIPISRTESGSFNGNAKKKNKKPKKKKPNKKTNEGPNRPHIGIAGTSLKNPVSQKDK